MIVITHSSVILLMEEILYQLIGSLSRDHCGILSLWNTTSLDFVPPAPTTSILLCYSCGSSVAEAKWLLASFQTSITQPLAQCKYALHTLPSLISPINLRECHVMHLLIVRTSSNIIKYHQILYLWYPSYTSQIHSFLTCLRSWATNGEHIE